MGRGVWTLGLLSLLLLKGQPLIAEESSTALLPVVFFTRDTGFGLGGFMISNLDRPAVGDPAQVLGLFSYTTQKQTIALLEPRLYSEDRTWEYGGRLYAQDYPATYYGREDRSLDPGEVFKEQRMQVSFRLAYRARYHLFWEADAEMLRSRFMDFVESPALSQEFTQWGKELNQHSATVAGGFDSRPSRIRPDQGTLVRLSHRRGLAQTEIRETQLAQSGLEVRHYLSLDARKSLVFQGLVAEIDPQPLPFYQLLGLGGSALLRGYPAQRFRDYAIALGQLEFRSLPFERWGYHVFSGFGDTSEHLSSMQFRDVQSSGGMGVDYLVDLRSKQNFRFDIGIGKQSFGVYLLFGNAF